MATSICTEDVDCTDNAQQIFWQENDKCLLFTMGWSGRLLFFVICSPSSREMLRCCLCNEVMPTEEAAPLTTGFYNLAHYISGIFDFTAHHEEVDVV